MALWGVLAAIALGAGALVAVSAGGDGERAGLPVALGSAGGRAEGALTADSRMAWVTYLAGDDLPALGGDAPAFRLSGAVDEAQVRALADALGVDGELVHDGQAWTIRGDGGTLEVYEGNGATWWFSAVGGDASIADSTGSGSSGGSGTSSGTKDECLDAPDHEVTNCIVDTTVVTDPRCTASDGPAECITGECPPEEPCALEDGDCDGAAAGDCSVGDCTPGTRCTPPPTTPGGLDCDGEGASCPHPTSDGDCAEVREPPCPDDTTNPPAPPPDLPSEDEARVIAIDLLAATDVDVDGADVTTEGPFDVWHVTVEPRLDGVLSGLLATVSIGSEGSVVDASGYLGRPERLGDYPVLDTRAAIDRANAQQGDGGLARGGPVVTAEGSDAGVDQEPAACEACDPIDGGAVSTVIDCSADSSGCGSGGAVASPPVTAIAPCRVQPDGSEICEPEPGTICPELVAPPAEEPLGAPEPADCTPLPPEPGEEPVPEPPTEPGPLEIVLVDAGPSLMVLPAIDGSADAYLVPAYRFTDADGGRVDLPAIADEALTGPPTTDTTVPDTVEPPTTDGGGDPQPCGDGLVEEDGTGTTPPPAPGCTEPAPAVLGEGEEPTIGVPYRVELILHCVVITDWAGQWWVPELLNPPTGWVGSGTLTLRAEGLADYVDDGAPDEPVAVRSQGPAAGYGGCD